jgi:hypothetical protein
MAEKNIDMDKIQYWLKWTDENGEEHFEKVGELKDEHCSFSLSDEIDEDLGSDGEEKYTHEDVVALCGKTLREKYFLEGMVTAYEKVLCIDDDDDEE